MEEASKKRVCIVWFHLYEVQKLINGIEIRMVAASRQHKGYWKDHEGTF